MLQKELATRLRVDGMTVSRWENGKQLSELRRWISALADVVGRSEKWLLYGEESVEAPSHAAVAGFGGATVDVASAAADEGDAEWRAGVRDYVVGDERGRGTPGPVVFRLLELPPEARQPFGYRAGVMDDVHRAREAIESGVGSLPVSSAPVAARLDPAWTAALERHFAAHGFPSPRAVTILYEGSTEPFVEGLDEGLTDIAEAVAQMRERAEQEAGDSRDARPAGRPRKAATKRRRR